MKKNFGSIVFGFKNMNPDEAEAMKEAFAAKGAEFDSVCVKYSKAQVYQYAKDNENVKTVIVMENLETKPYSAAELQKIKQIRPGMKVILSIADERKGTRYMQELYEHGIYRAVYDANTGFRFIYSLVCEERSRKATRKYYGLPEASIFDTSKMDGDRIKKNIELIEGSTNKNEMEQVLDHIKKMLSPAEIFVVLKHTGENDLEKIIQCRGIGIFFRMADFRNAKEKNSSGIVNRLMKADRKIRAVDYLVSEDELENRLEMIRDREQKKKKQKKRETVWQKEQDTEAENEEHGLPDNNEEEDQILQKENFENFRLDVSGVFDSTEAEEGSLFHEHTVENDMKSGEEKADEEEKGVVNDNNKEDDREETGVDSEYIQAESETYLNEDENKTSKMDSGLDMMINEKDEKVKIQSKEDCLDNKNQIFQDTAPIQKKCVENDRRINESIPDDEHHSLSENEKATENKPLEKDDVQTADASPRKGRFRKIGTEQLSLFEEQQDGMNSESDIMSQIEKNNIEVVQAGIQNAEMRQTGKVIMKNYGDMFNQLKTNLQKGEEIQKQNCRTKCCMVVGGVRRSGSTFHAISIASALRNQYKVALCEYNNGNGSFSEIGECFGMDNADSFFTIKNIDFIKVTTLAALEEIRYGTNYDLLIIDGGLYKNVSGKVFDMADTFFGVLSSVLWHRRDNQKFIDGMRERDRKAVYVLSGACKDTKYMGADIVCCGWQQDAFEPDADYVKIVKDRINL